MKRKMIVVFYDITVCTVWRFDIWLRDEKNYSDLGAI